jgi:GTPase SAR1 family protein
MRQQSLKARGRRDQVRRLKIISMGEPLVGKSCIIKRCAPGRGPANHGLHSHLGNGIHDEACSDRLLGCAQHLIEQRNVSLQLRNRFCEGQFVSKYILTIGIDYGVKQADFLPSHDVRLNFVDMAGAPEYAAIRAEFYEGAVFVYDPASRGTFEALPCWLEEARSCGANELV